MFRRSRKFVTLKICTHTPREQDIETLQHLRILKRLSKDDGEHAGRAFVNTITDYFQLEGEKGNHLCLVQRPLGESLSDYQTRIEGGKIPEDKIRYILRNILSALDYLHTCCSIVHTGMPTVPIPFNTIMIFRDVRACITLIETYRYQFE